MNILVTGANGQLGNHVRLLEKQSSHHFLFTDVEELDITDSAAVMEFVNSNSVQAIINCAAYTNVDKAEDDEQTADRINHLAPGYLAAAMKAVNGVLIHISTDYVFGGNQGNTPRTEEEPVSPTGAYGRTKLAGERAVIESGCHYAILRTAWLYSEFGNNFLKTMLRILPEKSACNVVFDQVGTPTYAGDLAKAIFAIVEHYDEATFHQGIYHFSNEGVCSWYDFSKEIARQANITNCKISPCHSNEFPSKVVRPSYSVLDKTKIKSTFGVDIPHWVESLKLCLGNMK